MTEQTDAAEVALTLPERRLLADRVLGGAEPSMLMIRAVERIIAAREAAAEARGAQAVLAAVEEALADTDWYCDDDHDWKGKATLADRLTWLAARAAAAAAGGGAS